MDAYHYLLAILLFYTVITIFAYREEIKEKETQLKYTEEQLKNLRDSIKTYIKEEIK